jgi:hypothetical protein
MWIVYLVRTLQGTLEKDSIWRVHQAIMCPSITTLRPWLLSEMPKPIAQDSMISEPGARPNSRRDLYLLQRRLIIPPILKKKDTSAYPWLCACNTA